jgi:hypothetical protein
MRTMILCGSLSFYGLVGCCSLFVGLYYIELPSMGCDLFELPAKLPYDVQQIVAHEAVD